MRKDISKIDFTKKENQTFRNWFALQWQNSYIQIFCLALFFFIEALISLDGWNLLAALIPFTTMAVIGYKAFYQFWDDMKKNISR